MSLELRDAKVKCMVREQWMIFVDGTNPNFKPHQEPLKLSAPHSDAQRAVTDPGFFRMGRSGR